MAQIFLPLRWWIVDKTLRRVFLQASRLSSMKSDIDIEKEDPMNEPLAARIVRRRTAELATSALPDAPVRPEPTPRRRPLAPHVRRRSAHLLVGLAGRLDPGIHGAA
jgi:hypothetical protein